MTNQAPLPPRARKVANKVSALAANHNRERRSVEAKLVIRWGRMRPAQPGLCFRRRLGYGWMIDAQTKDTSGSHCGPFATFREVQAFAVGIKDAAIADSRFSVPEAEEIRRRDGDARMATDAEWEAYREGAAVETMIRCQLRGKEID